MKKKTYLTFLIILIAVIIVVIVRFNHNDEPNDIIENLNEEDVSLELNEESPYVPMPNEMKKLEKNEEYNRTYVY